MDTIERNVSIAADIAVVFLGDRARYPEVDRRDRLSAKEFKDEFVPGNVTDMPLADFIDKVETLGWEDYPYYLRDDWRFPHSHPELVKHPRYRDAKPLETTIGPGDTIFAPGGWAHRVHSLDATISLSGNFMGPGCFSSCAPKIVKHMILGRIKSRLGLGE